MIPNDKIPMSGKVRVVIERANGTIEEFGEKSNDISNGVKGKIASSMQSGQTYGVSQQTLFDGDKFPSPTSSQSGIIIHTSSTKYETLTTEESASTAYKYKYKGIARAEASYSITGAILGYNWGGSSFGTEHATHSFNQSLSDGDQLTITWEITLADA